MRARSKKVGNIAAVVAQEHQAGGELALAAQLLEYMGRDSEMFSCCRTSLFEAGEPLVKRAQDAGALRADTNLQEIIHLVGGIAKIQVDAEQRDHILQITLDGLHTRD